MASPAVGSFEAVVLPHLDAAYNLARWLVRDPTLAEDVVQDATMRALGYFGTFRGGDGRAWLLRIVRNTAYDALAVRKRHAAASLEATGPDPDDEAAPLQVADPADDPEAALARRQDMAALDRALGALPVELRECLVLRELEELSYKEVAHITGVPIGTVMSRLWRARQALMQAGRRSEVMTAERCTEMHLLIQADVDGELAPAEAARVGAHVDGCPDCAELQTQLAELSGQIRGAATYHAAPASLRAALQARLAAPAAPLPQPARPVWSAGRFRLRWRSALPFGGGFAAAAALAMLLLLPRGSELADSIVADHIRALQPGT